MSTELQNAVPLFIIGPPRSGTTLLTKVLNAHPQIMLTYESAVFLLLNKLIEDARVGEKAGFFYGKEYHEEWSQFLAEHAQALIEGFYARVLHIQNRQEIRYWGDKHPHHEACMDFLDRLYPAARYIYILRDPRDTACSIAAMNKISFVEALDIWKRISTDYEDALIFLSPEQVYGVRYEQIVEDYTGRIDDILQWLQVPASAELQTFLEKYREFDVHRLAAGDRQKKDFTRQSVGRWQQELSDQDKAWADDLVGDFLDRYGYPRYRERATGS
jgi:hypothetical protein